MKNGGVIMNRMVVFCFLLSCFIVSSCEAPTSEHAKNDEQKDDELTYVDSTLAGHEFRPNTISLLVQEGKWDPYFTRIPAESSPHQLQATHDDSNIVEVVHATSDKLLHLESFNGIGPYSIGESNKLTLWGFDLEEQPYRAIAGNVYVTQFDTVSKKFSARFDAIAVRSDDTLRVIGRFNSIELSRKASRLSQVSINIDSVLDSYDQPENSLLLVAIDPGGSTTTRLLQPKLSSSEDELVELYALLRTGIDPYLSVQHGSISLLGLANFDGVDLYELSMATGNYIDHQIIGSAGYRSISGKVNVTDFDTVSHIFSAQFDAICRSSSLDTLRIIGRYRRLQLMSTSFEQSIVVSGLKLDATAGYSESKDSLVVSGKFTKSLSCLDSRGGQTYELITAGLAIADPSVRVYAPTEAEWFYREKEVSAYPANCLSYKDFKRKPKSTDRLVVTKWDPVTQTVSGRFSVDGLEGEFSDLVWKRYP
jgi:hypothetical protein